MENKQLIQIMPQCQAIFCQNKTGNCKKSFFQIPDPTKSAEHTKLCRKWLENLKNGKLNIETFKAHRKFVVCEDHFTKECFDGIYSNSVASSLSFLHKRKSLKKNAVPTLVGLKLETSRVHQRRNSAEIISGKRQKAQVRKSLDLP